MVKLNATIKKGFDKKVLVWDLKSGQIIYHLAKHHSEITHVQVINLI